LAHGGHGLTGSAADVVQSKLSDSGVELEQERERLANATGSTEDSNLGQLIGRRAAGQHKRSGIQSFGGLFSREQVGEGRISPYVAGRGRESSALDSSGQHFFLKRDARN
jgi:hypothetical protein